MLKKTGILVLFVLLFLPTFIFAENLSCEKWTVMDIQFKAETTILAPFDVHMGAVLSREDGVSMTIPAFYNDDNTWIVRFCPPERGKWTYETYSSFPLLAGRKGVIEVTANTKADEHGPVVISKKYNQKFEYADGTPYFLLAFELDWLFALDWKNENDIPKTKSIISEVAAHGFNQVIMNVYAYDAGWGDKESIAPENNYARPGVFPYGGSNENPDYSTLNIDFFKHLDRVMAHLNEKEIISHLMIYVWNKKVNWAEPNSKADNMYFDYVVKRYQAFPNLIWDISKEALGYGHNDMGYITDRIDRLRKLDGHGRLLSVHDYQYCNAFPEKVDFISIQHWVPNIYDATRRVKDKHASKPIFNIEHGGYEKSMHSIFDGAYNDPVVCLDRNYKIVFAGAYSTYYWQNSAWYEVVSRPFDLPKQKQPKFSYLKNFADLFSKYDFQILEPAQFGFTPYCLTDYESIYLFYIPDGMIKVAGDVRNLVGKRVSVTWYDPLEGRYMQDEPRTMNAPWLSFSPPTEITSPMKVMILEVVE